MADSSVVIAHYNTPRLLRLGLASLLRFGPPGLTITVVDTGSTPAVLQWLQSLRGAGIGLEQLTMPGAGAEAHGAALDLGLSLAVSRRFLVTMDSDVFLRAEGWLEALVRPAERDSSVAVVGAIKAPRFRIRHLFRRRTRRSFPYVRPWLALYRVAALAGTSFCPAGGLTVGEEICRSLSAGGRRVFVLPASQMDSMATHVKHGTMVENPGLFPRFRRRSHRSGYDRLSAALADPLARKLLAGCGLPEFP